MVRRLPALAVLCLLAVATAARSPGADLAEHNHWKRLRALVEPRVRANPNDAEAQWLLSQVRMAYKDADAALAPAEKAVALDAKNVEYRWQLAQVVGEQAQQASVFRQMGLAKRYKAEVEAALAINPRHVDALSGLMEYYNRAPGIVGGDKKKAAEMVDQIMAINKVDGCLAKIQLLPQGPERQAQVEQAYVEAVHADPSRLEPHLSLANIYSQGSTPRWELAEKEALIAKKIDPDRVTAYQILSGVYASQERWADLEANIAEAEKKIPDNLAPYLRASGALLATGKDLPRAERYARKYLTQDPEPTAATPALAHWRLGLILEKEGRKPDAVAELQTATTLDPKFEPAQKDLKRLKT